MKAAYPQRSKWRGNQRGSIISDSLNTWQYERNKAKINGGIGKRNRRRKHS
jgi:hypothetical protein